MAERSVRTLAVPPDVAANGGQEVLRAFVANGDLAVSLVRAFDAPEMWGMLMVDVVRQVSLIFAAEDGLSARDVQLKILGMMSTELFDPSDLGTTTTLNT